MDRRPLEGLQARVNTLHAVVFFWREEVGPLLGRGRSGWYRLAWEVPAADEEDEQDAAANGHASSFPRIRSISGNIVSAPHILPTLM